MDEYRAKLVVAVAALRASWESHPPEWEDYPEIGESDWDDILDEVSNLVSDLEVFSIKEGEFKVAYDFLAARANQEEQ